MGRSALSLVVLVALLLAWFGSEWLDRRSPVMGTVTAEPEPTTPPIDLDATPPTGPGPLYVTVEYDRIQMPFPGAVVTVDDGDGRRWRQMVDDDGWAVFPSVPSRNPTIDVEAGGWEMVADPEIERLADGARLAEVKLAAGRPFVGHVVDADTGRPIDGARIRATGLTPPMLEPGGWGRSGGWTRTARSDSSGRFAIPLLEHVLGTSSYAAVECRAQGHATVSPLIDGVVKLAAATAFTVRMPKGRSLEGTIRFVDDRPPSSATVSAAPGRRWLAMVDGEFPTPARSLKFDMRGIETNVSVVIPMVGAVDAQGNWRVDGVPLADPVWIRVVSMNTSRQREEFDVMAPVIATDGSPTRVDLVLADTPGRPNRRATGKDTPVADQPAPDRSVAASPSSHRVWGGAVDERGNPFGRVIIRTRSYRGTAVVSGERGRFHIMTSDGRFPDVSAPGREVEHQGDSLTSARVIMTRRACARFVVEPLAGAPPCEFMHVSEFAELIASPPYVSRTGRWELLVSAHALVHGGVRVDPRDGMAAFRVPTGRRYGGDGPSVLRPTLGCSVFGRVVDDSGAAISGAYVSGHEAGWPAFEDESRFLETVSDVDGRFVLTGFGDSGTIDVVAVAADGSSGRAWIGVEGDSEGRRARRIPNAVELRVDRQGTILVTARDPMGRRRRLVPLGVRDSAPRGDSPISWVRRYKTDGAGELRVLRRPGSYEVVLFEQPRLREAGVVSVHPIVVRAGATTVLDLVVEGSPDDE